MTRNPVTDVERPRIEQPEMRVLSEVEIARLWTACAYLHTKAKAEVGTGAVGARAAWWRLAHTITFTALGTAMRRGELLGLRWRDVQLLEGRLHVRDAFVNGRATAPKSRASRRMIELGPRTTDLLADHYTRTAFGGHDEGGSSAIPNSGRRLIPASSRARICSPPFGAQASPSRFAPSTTYVTPRSPTRLPRETPWFTSG